MHVKVTHLKSGESFFAFLFCFQKPKRGGKCHPSLASRVIKNIQKFLSDPLAPIEVSAGKSSRLSEGDDARAKLVAKKLANGDVKGAIRVLSSKDSFLPFDPKTYSLLKSKHP